MMSFISMADPPPLFPLLVDMCLLEQAGSMVPSAKSPRRVMLPAQEPKEKFQIVVSNISAKVSQ